MNKVNVRAYCIRPIFTAIIALAIAFTFIACSSGGDDDTPPDNNPSGGISNGTGSFSGAGAGDKAQAYTVDWNWNMVDKAYTKYTGNGDIKIGVKIGVGCAEKWENCEYKDAGKIESGFVKLQLPSSIDSKYLMDIGDLPPSCNAPADVKALMVWGFRIPDIGSLLLEYCEYESGERCESVEYLYSSGPANISCNFRDDKLGDVSLSLNLEKGWNEVYTAEKGSYYISTDKSVLDHLNDIKWVILDKD